MAGSRPPLVQSCCPWAVIWGQRPGLIPQGSGLSGVVIVVCCGPLTVLLGVLCSVVVSSYLFLSLTPVAFSVLAAV